VKNIRWSAVWIGCAVVATVLALNSIGVFRWLEDWTIDLRFRYGRWEIDSRFHAATNRRRRSTLEA